MICFLSARRLKPGAFNEFRRAWEPERWPAEAVRAYHLRSSDDENLVVSFGLYEGGLADRERIRTGMARWAGEASRPRPTRPRRRVVDAKPGVPHQVGRSQRPLPRHGRQAPSPPRVVGDLELSYEAITLSADSGLRMFAYTAEPGSKPEEALNLLASWSATTDQPELTHTTDPA
jgi:hypothetical protein